MVGYAGKGLFDGCIYAAMQDVVSPETRASAVGLMTMVGFLGAGLAPLMVAKLADTFGMAFGLSSLAGLYALAVAVLLVSLRPMRAGILAARAAPPIVQAAAA
jgi:MFS family permease